MINAILDTDVSHLSFESEFVNDTIDGCGFSRQLERIQTPMTSNRLYTLIVILSASVIGCGGAEPKKLPPQATPEVKAQNDKAHEEAKAAAGAPAGGATEPPK